MHQLLKYLHELLVENNIPYWVSCGTLLGCVRHQGFIPWDDDIDINIELKYKIQLVALTPRLERDGYILCSSRGGFKCGFNNFACYPFVDIILVNEDRGILRLCYPLDKLGNCTYEVGEQWPNECFKSIDVFPLKTLPFEDFMVFVPNQHLRTLKQIYDDDCLDSVSSKSDTPYGYSIKRLPWIMNHYYDNLLFRMGIHKG
ncbi:MAG: LicD family protein [Gammaproteobacteria bacterium]|nr:LicD family protein [Gammaproteobacteria bacterium]